MSDIYENRTANEFPRVVRTSEWVAVQWDDVSPWLMVTDTTKTEYRWTLPNSSSESMVPLPGA